MSPVCVCVATKLLKKQNTQSFFDKYLYSSDSLITFYWFIPSS